MTVRNFLSHFKAVHPIRGGWIARCPVHDDSNPSLSISERSGNILVHCHAGCETSAIVNSIGLTLADLFADHEEMNRKRVVASYAYTDKSGNLLFEVVRFEPKDFRQRRSDGSGGWIWNLEGVPRVLYKLPAVIQSENILILEGEKDCDTAARLGFVATCNPGGAGKWRPEFSEFLAGKIVTIICDADMPGVAHGRQVAHALLGVAASIKLIEALPQAKDLTEWVELGGGDLEGAHEQLLKIIAETPPFAAAEVTKEQLAEKEKAPEPIAKVPYPKIPEEAWYGISKLYRKAVENSTEASDNYHLAGFYAAFAAILGKSVFTYMGDEIEDEEVYPLFFMVFIGESSDARKGTAINYLCRLATRVDPNVYITRTLDSRESFIRDCAAAQKSDEHPKRFSSIHVILRLGELRALLEKAEQKGVRNMIPMLFDAYDCFPFLDVKSGEKAIIKEPFVILAAGTTSVYLQQLTLADIEGGLGNRLLFIPGDPKPRIYPRRLDREMLSAIIVRLHEIAEHYQARSRRTLLQLTKEADRRFKKFYEHEFNPPVEDKIIHALSARDHLVCMKIALLNAALDQSDVIESHHLEAAIAFVNFLYKARFPVFAGHGLNPMARLDQQIIDHVKRFPQGIPWSRLRHAFHRTDVETFARRMRFLTEEDGPLSIRRPAGGRKRWVVAEE